MIDEEISKFRNSLEIGNEFQDFVCIQLYKIGIIIQNINTKRFQYEVGENLQGIEIKYDARSTGCSRYKFNKPTNRIGIEVAERTSINKLWTPSGILRTDNSWLYIVGNYNTFWIFSKKDLINIYEQKLFKVEETKSTMKGFFIPIDEANKIALRKFEFEKEEYNKIDWSYIL